MEFKILTQQIHEIYHTHNSTWKRSTNFIIKIHKDYITQISTYEIK